MAAAPPDVALSKAQTLRDEELLQSIMPEAGMPSDVRIDIRVIGYSSPAPQ
jgi:hypothetical protein